MRTPSPPSVAMIRRGFVLAALAVAASGLAVHSAGALELKLPAGVTEPFALRLYGEQLDSQESIEALVSGEIESFEVLSRDVQKFEAVLKVRVHYTDGSTRDGFFTLNKGSKAWYLRAVKRTTTRVDVVPEDLTPDVGVLNTMLAEQEQHAEMTARIVDGSYDTVVLGEPKRGYRSVVVPCTFSGEKMSTPGEVTAVSRTERGSTSWFVVSFSQ